MNFWKMLGGAALGVGAIAAAPFTGGGSVLAATSLAASLAGAGTIAAAVGAGAVGAAIGANMGDEDSARDAGYREGKNDGKAESVLKQEALEKKLGEAIAKLKDSAAFFNAIYALEAVGVAAANCDGHVCDAERDQISMFVKGISDSALPKEVKEKVASLYETPVNIKEAFSMAKNSGVDMSVFDDVVALVISADGITHENEKAFMQGWNSLKVA